MSDDECKEVSFTPGPWFLDDDGQWFAVCANNHCVAHVHAPTLSSVDRALADATLIAAAPDMYAALEYVLAELGERGPDDPLYIATQRVRAAINRVGQRRT